MDRGWERARKRALGRLREHADRGLVDADIVEFLLEFNRRPCLFTTSSCSGRVVVLEGADFFDKRGARILEAWHDPRECRARIGAYCSRRGAWLSLQPPILHVVARDEEVARRLVACGEASGFRRSCYKPYRAGGYHVELAAGDKMHVPLPADCNVALRLCGVLEVYKERLRRLEECLLRLDC